MHNFAQSTKSQLLTQLRLRTKPKCQTKPICWITPPFSISSTLLDNNYSTGAAKPLSTQDSAPHTPPATIPALPPPDAPPPSGDTAMPAPATRRPQATKG